METLPISKFRASCIAVLERVRRTRKPILITRFGKPIAEIMPPSAPPRPRGWLGCMKGKGRIRGNIVSPVLSSSDWEATGK